MNNVGEVLLKAADMLEEPGVWGQNEEVVDRWGRQVPGRLCVALAIEKAADGNLDHHLTASEVLKQYIFGEVPNRLLAGAPTLPIWNDKPERTAVEVVQALRAAAKGVQ